ncbi:MAG TPA: dethiobiotin synthase [Gemmatimonadales bacterium]|nr:dethiobiotin synthase [Gemmatimonadales bacterium]
MSETRRSNIVVVTGTDSDVGKTWVTAALARALVAAGASVRALKLVETGCRDDAREREDGVILARATGQDAPVEALYRFPDDMAPVLAAERRGVSLDFDDALLSVERYAERCDILLLEGASGLLSPFTWEWCLVDVAQALEARAILVGSDRLGTLNHALLTLGALELAAVPVVDTILTPPPAADPSTGTNAQALRRLSGVPRVVTVPRTDDPELAAAALRDTAERLRPARTAS